MAATKQAIIAIQGPYPDEAPFKVVRLVASRDGSYSVSVPYHPAQTGLLFKGAPKTPLETPTGERSSKMAEIYRVDVPVKLSHHASGFVQFSSAGKTPIRSGRGAFFVPNGLGVNSQNLLDPIETGPTWGVTFREISECQQIDGTEKVPVLVFDPRDWWWRDEHDLVGRHVFNVEGWVFPAARRRDVHLGAKGWTLTTGYGVHRPEWVMDFRVFDLLSGLAFIGLTVTVMHGSRSEHGYTINSPRDIVTGSSLHAIYPIDDVDLQRDIPSLLYVPGEST